MARLQGKRKDPGCCMVAFCGEPELLDGRRDVLLNPSLVVEALSDSNYAYDRGEKFSLYRHIPTLKEYLLVSQGQVLVELYSRGEHGRWVLSDYRALTDRLQLPSLDCKLDLAEIYDKVAIAGGSNTPVESAARILVGSTACSLEHEHPNAI